MANATKTPPVTIPPQLAPEPQNQIISPPIKNTPDPLVTPTTHVEGEGSHLANPKVILDRYLPKLIALGLAIQGLKGLYESLNFIFSTYPMLERQLIAHQIIQDQINQIAAQAILMVISTVLSMFFALKLTVLKTKAAKWLSSGIAVTLFLGNAYLFNYFSQSNSAATITEASVTVVNVFLAPLRWLLSLQR